MIAGTGAPGPCVIVPVQAVGSAKSRLAEVLPDRDRAELVLAMLTDVLAVVRVAHDGPLLLVTPDEQYEPAAAAARATLLIDAGTGYNEAVRLALASPEVEAAGAAVVVPADQARAQASELRTASMRSGSTRSSWCRRLTAGPGCSGCGRRMRSSPRTGRTRPPRTSGPRVRRAARIAVLRLASLERDIDTAGDLADVAPPLGPRTAAFVASRRALLAG